MKVLREGAALHGDALARFAREARAAGALGHPNIVSVLDFQLLPNEPPFLVLEYLEGQTLGARLRQEPRLDVHRACAIAHQLLLALEAAHGAGIVHRDIKPDNVFLLRLTGAEDFVKLLDFGIAKLQNTNATSLTEAGSMLGTPAFMAPEQIASTDVDHRADIYGVGALLYCALAGRHPFEAPNASALLYAIAHTKPAPLVSVNASIDPALALVIERAMHKDREGRFRSAAEMRAALIPWSQPREANMGLAPGHLSPQVVPQRHLSTDPTELAGTRTTEVANPPQAITAPSNRTGLILAIVGALLAFFLLLVAGIVGLVVYLHDAEPTPTPSASRPAPPATDTAAPVAPTSGGALVSTTTDAGAAPRPSPSPLPPTPSGKRMGARTATFTLGDCTFELAECQAAIARVMPSVQACFAATEFDPPMHEVADYSIMLDKAGAVTEVRRHKSGENSPHAKLDACVATALRNAKYPRSPGNTRVEVFFRARV